MQVDVERRSGSQVALTVTVEPADGGTADGTAFPEVCPSRHGARISSRQSAPPISGSADRAHALLKDAVEDVIESTYKDALQEQGIEPLERGEIEDVKTGEDLSLTYRVIVSVRPQIILPDIADLVVELHRDQSHR